jgi:uncharacterized damage-inducible protein DinB
MRRSLILLSLLAAPLGAQVQQSANAQMTATKSLFMMAHGNVLAAAEQVPESLYSFKPTPQVRSLGQLFGHVADAQAMICAAASSSAPAAGESNEKKTAKADLIAALKASAAACESALAMSDVKSGEPVSLFGMNGTRLWALNFNASHTMEHYGNIVTYMRLKGLVPPTSQR